MEELRAARHLRLITKEEAGASIDDIANGLYGFTYAPQSEGIPLFETQGFQVFEVHKLHDGSVHILGYMTAEQAIALDSSGEPRELKLYPEPYQEAQSFVSLPQSRILRVKPVSRELGNWMPVTVAPA